MPPSGSHRRNIHKFWLADSRKPARKRIVICCDGTWQSSTDLKAKHSIPSNVTRLSRVIANAGNDRRHRTWQQIVYYGAGIGTGDLTWWDTLRQGKYCTTITHT